MSRNPNPSNSNKSCIMNKSLNVALAILFGGTASLAVAQSPKESFADTFATMQRQQAVQLRDQQRRFVLEVHIFIAQQLDALGNRQLEPDAGRSAHRRDQRIRHA